MILTANNLTEQDKQNAKALVHWFKLWKQQGRLPMTQATLINGLNKKLGWQYTEHSFSAIINYCRLELDEWIISSNSGLDYAVTIEEKERFIEYLEAITLPRLETIKWARRKLAQERQAEQINLFEQN